MNIRPFVEKVFGEDNVDILGIDAGKALLYLVRRFGYTENGGDDQKSICTYVIRTKMDGVQVQVFIGGKRASFSVAMARDVGDAYCEEDNKTYRAWHKRCRVWAEGLSFDTDTQTVISQTSYEKIAPFPDAHIALAVGTVMYDVQTAVTNTLKDLLLPVFVRSQAINILGSAEERDFGEWLGDEERDNRMVEPHWSSGLGMILEPYRDIDLFYDFLEATKERGGGDLQKGMRLVMGSGLVCIPDEVGAQLKELRQGQRLTQMELAGMINRNTAAIISYYERGLRPLTLNKLEELAGVLGYDVEIVMRKKGSPAV